MNTPINPTERATAPDTIKDSKITPEGRSWAENVEKVIKDFRYEVKLNLEESNQ